MSLIADRDKATRLARAIVADIVLYNKEAITTKAPSLTKEVGEGRALFEARVVPELHGVFDSAVRESLLEPWAGEAPPRAVPPERAPLDPLVEASPATRPDKGSITGLLVGLVVVVVITAAVLAFLVRR